MISQKTLLSAVLISCLGAAPSAAGVPRGGFFGRVVQVYSGDQILVSYHGAKLHVRVYGVQCPIGPRGVEAKALTSQLALSRSAWIVPRGQDGRGNSIAKVSFVGGSNLSEALIRSGLARWSRDNAPHERKFAYLEGMARAERRGLWADPVRELSASRIVRRRRRAQSARPMVLSENKKL